MKKKSLLLLLCLAVVLGAVLLSLVLVSANDGRTVESISLAEGCSLMQIENCGGYWNTRYNVTTQTHEEFYYYREVDLLENVEITVNYTDGSDETVSYYNEDPRYNFSFIYGQYITPWTVGGENVLTILLGEVRTECNVVIVESPLERIEVINDGPVTLVENGEGEWMEDPHTQGQTMFFKYSLRPIISSIEYRLIYKDGREVVTEGGLWSEVDGHGFGWNDDQFETHWKIGVNNIFTIDIMGCFLDIPIEIVPNPVESLEIIEGTLSPLIENIDGYWDSYYDPEADKQTDYFCYFQERALRNAQLKVNYKDGGYDIFNYGYTPETYLLQWENDQQASPWSVDGENVVTVSYMGVTLDINIEVIQIPIESLEIVEGTLDSIIENTNGQINSRFDEALGDYVEYYEYSVDAAIQNLQIRINYKNGTHEIASIYSEVDGYFFSVLSNQHETPWTVGGQNTMIISIMGVELPVNVTIEENPIDRIEVIPESLTPLIENSGGYWTTRYNPETDAEEEFYLYELSNALRGARYKIYYSDGTDEEYCPDGWATNANQYKTPWSVGGENIVHIEFELPNFGWVTADVNIIIIESPIESIEPVGNTDFSIIEYSNGEFVTEYDEETGSEIEYFYYEIGNIIDRLKIRINYKDGRDSVEVYAYEEVDGYCFTWSHNQQKTPWTMGGENVICIEYLGAELNINVEILPNPIESIEAVEGTVGKVIENVNGRYEWYYDEELECEVRYFDYYLGPVLQDMKIRINYKDGTNKVTSVYDCVDGYSFSWRTNQFSSPWVIGGENKIFIEYMGKVLELDVIVEPYPIESIEPVEGTIKPLIENTDGYWEHRYNEDTQSEEAFFRYSAGNALNEAQFKICYTDGTEEIVDISDWSADSDQYQTPWSIGNNNELTLHFYVDGIGEVSTVINVTVIPTPVVSIEILDGATLDLYENAGGYMSDRYDEATDSIIPFYYYEYYDMASELMLKVTFNDQTTQIIGLRDEYEGRSPSVEDDQHNDPWLPGSDSFITVSFMGRETTVKVNILPNPVESIEVLDDTIGTLIEFADANKEPFYDDNTGTLQTYYQYIEYKALEYGKIKINYTNGESKTIGLYDLYNGYAVNITCNQDYYNPWVIGGENEVTIEYMGAYDTVNIVIVPGPVESIEVIEGSIKPLIKEYDGYTDYYYDHETGDSVEFFYYNCETITLGAKLLVTFKDGNTVILGCNDEHNGYSVYCYDDQYQSPWTVGGENIISFSYMGIEVEYSVEIIECPLESITVDMIDFGELIYNDAMYGYIYNDEYYLAPEIKGLKFTVKYKNGSEVTYTLDDRDDCEYSLYFNSYLFAIDFGEEPAVIGKNTVTVNYMGLTAQVEVNVAETPVEYIKVIKAPDITHYTKKIDKNGEGYRFEPIYDGIEFEIKYKNGNVITVSEHTAEAAYMLIDGSYLYTITLDDGTMLVAGELDGKYIATYRGAYCDIDCIEYTEGKEISDFTVKNFKYNGDGMSVTIEYADGTYETVTLDVVEWGGEMDESVVFGLAKTEKGMVTYYIINYDDNYFYRIYLLDTVIEYVHDQTVETGDADGDGEINSDDAIHLLYAVLFGTQDYELSQECDFDGNGEVNSDDAIYLLYHVLFGEVDYPLS